MNSFLYPSCLFTPFHLLLLVILSPFSVSCFVCFYSFLCVCSPPNLPTSSIGTLTSIHVAQSLLAQWLGVGGLGVQRGEDRAGCVLDAAILLRHLLGSCDGLRSHLGKLVHSANSHRTFLLFLYRYSV